MELGGSIITDLRSARNQVQAELAVLEEIAGFDLSECSYPGIITFGSLRALP